MVLSCGFALFCGQKIVKNVKKRAFFKMRKKSAEVGGGLYAASTSGVLRNKTPRLDPAHPGMPGCRPRKGLCLCLCKKKKRVS
jgi:hypothetical protein